MISDATLATVTHTHTHIYRFAPVTLHSLLLLVSPDNKERNERLQTCCGLGLMPPFFIVSFQP